VTSWSQLCCLKICDMAVTSNNGCAPVTIIVRFNADQASNIHFIAFTDLLLNYTNNGIVGREAEGSVSLGFGPSFRLFYVEVQIVMCLGVKIWRDITTIVS